MWRTIRGFMDCRSRMTAREGAIIGIGIGIEIGNGTATDGAATLCIGRRQAASLVAGMYRPRCERRTMAMEEEQCVTSAVIGRMMA